MILYFTGTGNTLDAARRIAQGTDDEVKPIIDYAEKCEILGICYPVYFSGLPIPVKEFFETYDFGNVKYLYAVATYGGGIGGADRMIADILKKRGFALNASFGMTFPDNYIPMFDLPDEKTAEKILSSTYPQISRICEKINARVNTDILTKPSGNMLRKLMYKMYLNGRKTDKFFVEENCINCGICAQNCPAKIIEIKDKPVWKEKQCYLCLSCINRCPVQAIQYGKKTKSRNRYTNPILK